MEKLQLVLTWFYSNWPGLLAVVFTFGFMIFVHELGHFIMAKRVGITVLEFALGFGPRLLRFGGGKKRKERADSDDESPSGEPGTVEPIKTEYCLRMIPFGGFVRMEGEDEQGNLDDPGNFNNKSVFARLKVIVGGCIMNYLAGIALLMMVGFIWGMPRPPAIIASLSPDYPLEKAGFLRGDEIIAINDQKINDFFHLSEIISPLKNGETVNLTVRRKDKIITKPIQVKYNEKEDRGMLGFSADRGPLNFTFTKVVPLEVVRETLHTTFRLTTMPITIVKFLLEKKITTAEVARESAGPVGIGQMLFEVSKRGIPKLLYITAILSILIGAFNLLPLPALDGSRALFIFIEMLRRKPIDPEKEGIVHQVGFVLLIILVIIVTYNDIMRIIRGENIFK